jgi:hypothetical protein
MFILDVIPWQPVSLGCPIIGVVVEESSLQLGETVEIRFEPRCTALRKLTPDVIMWVSFSVWALKTSSWAEYQARVAECVGRELPELRLCVVVATFPGTGNITTTPARTAAITFAASTAII